MSSLPTRYFIDLTQPEIAAQLRRNPLVIFPAGSVEQHGPHLPTGTDIYAANVIAHAVADQMDGLVFARRSAGGHPDARTLRRHDYVDAGDVHAGGHRNMRQHGAARRAALPDSQLSTHEGNIPSLSIAADALHREHGMSVVTVQACYVAEELFGDDYGGLTHGGEIEALAVLAYRPELVHLDRMDYSSNEERGQEMDRLRRTRSFQPVLTDIRSIAPTGWYGSPEHATAEKARRMLDRVADAISGESEAIFTRLDAVQGGTAEVRRLQKVG